MTRKNSEIVYLVRSAKAFHGDDNWHGPITWGEAQSKGLLSTSSGTIRVTVFSDEHYADMVARNTDARLAGLPTPTHNGETPWACSSQKTASS